ncbi:hypothetical protein U3516DRAFT_780812 [Neocallimastix sp. 'constans']
MPGIFMNNMRSSAKEWEKMLLVVNFLLILTFISNAIKNLDHIQTRLYYAEYLSLDDQTKFLLFN